MVTTVADAVQLVRTVCARPGAAGFLDTADREAKAARLSVAIRGHDTPALYDWLMDGFSFQGISDRIAWDYIQRHGNSSWQAVERLLANTQCRCPKLAGSGAYHHCGYRKTAATCANPIDLPSCPVPALPLRKGDLNQLAFSLFFFLRDCCQGDLVGFIDDLLGRADEINVADPWKFKADVILTAFAEIHAVSAKLIAMMLGTLLLAGGSIKPEWVKVSRSLVVIDSLVHNFLHRTGILAAFDHAHLYGPACHGALGCTAVVNHLAHRIDARDSNPRFPRYFPRFIEFAIWSFCAETRADICNGRRIDDRAGCDQLDCPVGEQCSRVALRPVSVEPRQSLG